ncbi:hypothetical protein Tco_0154701 [Tanacetum coccineum]
MVCFFRTRFDELMEHQYLSLAGTHFGSVVDDKVLHRVMTVVKESTFVDQWVKVVVNTKEDYTENDGCSGKKVCDDS